MLLLLFVFFHVVDITKRQIFDRGHAFANTSPVQVSGFKRLNFRCRVRFRVWVHFGLGQGLGVEFMGFFEGAL